ncbi:MAG: hypothetical protein K9L78_02550 [Victivallales bacterium]|nr:hypothetical protein [Victivallales bacterium]MCF7888976.1 hypothetical protein [Victivallales bacterium]
MKNLKNSFLKLSKKSRFAVVILLLILTFTLGGSIGIKLTSDYYESLFNKFEYYNPSFNIVECVKTLGYLRKNEINKAIHFEEWRLDDNIMKLSNSIKKSYTHDKRLLKFAMSALKLASSYRKDYSYEEYQTETTKKTVNKALDLACNNTKKK